MAVFADGKGNSNDNVYIMIAGLKTVCQSIDLIGCHAFEGLEI